MFPYFKSGQSVELNRLHLVVPPILYNSVWYNDHLITGINLALYESNTLQPVFAKEQRTDTKYQKRSVLFKISVDVASSDAWKVLGKARKLIYCKEKWKNFFCCVTLWTIIRQTGSTLRLNMFPISSEQKLSWKQWQNSCTNRLCVGTFIHSVTCHKFFVVTEKAMVV
jgi:hypothetical protein